MHMCMSCHQKHPQSEEWGSMAIKVSVSQYGLAVLEFHRSKQPKHLQGLAINNVGQVKEDLGCETWGDMSRQQKPAYICKPNVHLTWIIIPRTEPTLQRLETVFWPWWGKHRGNSPRIAANETQKSAWGQEGAKNEPNNGWVGAWKWTGAKGLDGGLDRKGIEPNTRKRKMRWQGWDGWTSGEWIGRCMAQAIFSK